MHYDGSLGAASVSFERQGVTLFNHGASQLRRCICYRKGQRSDAGTKEDHQWLRPALSHDCGNVLVGMGYAVGSSSHSVVRSAPTAGARRKRSCKTTSSAGYPTVQATNEVRANSSAEQAPRATSSSRPSSARSLPRLLVHRGRICMPSISASRGGGASHAP